MTTDYLLTSTDEKLTQKIALLVVCAGSMMSPLTMSSVNIAMPAMAAELQADARLVSWLPTIFLISNVALILPFGKLADNIGRKRIYMIGLLVTAITSLGAAMAASICLLYTSPSPRDRTRSRMPSSA